MISKPYVIAGGIHVDARGVVSFVNDFDFKGVDRFYMIRSHRRDEPRGWVGHQRERKWFTAVQGSVLVAVVRPDNLEKPAASLPVERFVLSGLKPSVLCVPAGCATAQLSLSDDAILMVFSSGSIADAKSDDYRFDLHLWPVAEG